MITWKEFIENFGAAEIILLVIVIACIIAANSKVPWKRKCQKK